MFFFAVMVLFYSHQNNIELPEQVLNYLENKFKEIPKFLKVENISGDFKSNLWYKNSIISLSKCI